MPRTATIGPAVYKRVTELTAEGQNRTEAFQTVAQERSMNPGTVSANYYRVAPSQGGTTKRPKTRARKATATATRKTTRTKAPRGRAATQPKADTDLITLANQIGDLVQQLVRQVEERDRRIREVLG